MSKFSGKNESPVRGNSSTHHFQRSSSTKESVSYSKLGFFSAKSIFARMNATFARSPSMKRKFLGSGWLCFAIGAFGQMLNACVCACLSF